MVSRSQQTACRRYDLWMVLLIVALVPLCFFPTFQNGFAYDDAKNLSENVGFRGLSPSHLRWMFTTFHMGHYQPLSWLTLAVDYRCWGLDPTGYHVTSLVLHTANAVLVYFLGGAILALSPVFTPYRDTLGFRLCCAVSALFFAIHPLRVESVAWATERRDVLSGLFYVLTVIVYVQMARTGVSRGTVWRYVLAWFLFALSLLSKAWGMTLPVVLLILDVYPLRRITFGPQQLKHIKKCVLEKVPFALLAVASAVLALLAQYREGAMRQLADHGYGARLLQAAYGLCFYPWKTLIPTRLSPLYLLRSSFPSAWATYALCAVAAGGLTVWLVLMRRRWPWALGAWACYAVIVSPVLGLAQSGLQIVADRYTYLSCLPFALLLGAGLFRGWLTCRAGRACRRRTVVCILAPTGVMAALCVLSVLTFLQVRVWHDDRALWEHVVRVGPANYVALVNRGNLRKEQGDTRGALADYERAIRSNPRYALAFHNRGLMSYEAGRLAEALEDYTTAIQLNPTFAPTYANRAVVHELQGDLDGALADCDTAIGLERGLALCYMIRAHVLQTRGDLARALEDYDRAVGVDPESTEAYYSRGVLRRQMGDLDGAVADYGRTIRLVPTHVLAHNNRGCVYRMKGDSAKALADFGEAIRLDPTYPDAYANRGYLHAHLRDYAAAAEDLRKALQLAPPDWRGRAEIEQLLSRSRAQIRSK